MNNGINKVQPLIKEALPKANIGVYIPFNLFKGLNIKPNDLKVGLSQKLGELKDAFNRTKIANLSLVRQPNLSTPVKYSDSFLKEYVEKKFIDNTLFEEKQGYTDVQKAEIVSEAKAKAIFYLTEYKNACYAGDVMKAQKMLAIFFSPEYLNNTDFRGQCFHLMENIANNSGMPKLVSAQEFTFGVLSLLAPEFKFETINNVLIFEGMAEKNGSLIKSSCELITTIVLAKRNLHAIYCLTGDKDLTQVLKILNIEDYGLKGKIPQKDSDLIVIDHETKTYSVREIKTTYPNSVNLDTFRNKTYNMGTMNSELYNKALKVWRDDFVEKITQKLSDNSLSDLQRLNYNNLIINTKQGKTVPFVVSNFHALL